MRRTVFAAGMRAGMRRSRRAGTAGHTNWAHPAPYHVDSRSRRFMRFILRRVALLAALLILFYATSLHGINLRTFILAGLLILSLYWLFRDAL